ncbi:MAG: peptidylprolyl isomerase [Anaerolineae bacterium]|nr:peptidylprolyl isomerase [Anaerolineae bacterium]
MQSRQYTQCPPMIIDPSARYVATIQTEKGKIVLELYADVAPLAVNNFVFLATHGWYDNVTFHRVLDGFMAQAGDPSGTGFGGPGYAFENEISNLRFNSEGLLAMANAGPDSNGSQFFITLGPAGHLDGGFTIFGSVLNGMDVVKSLSLRNPEEGLGLPPGDKILTITIEQR